MRSIPVVTCPRRSSPFATRTGTSQTRARTGMRDSITDPSLPAKRLIWGAIGGEYYIVHYERGGIAHTYHMLVATLVNNDAKPNVVWRAVGGPFKNYAVFLDALRSGKLDDRLGKSKFW